MSIKLIMENWNKFLREEEVKDKKKADLDKDGKLSGYEKKRAAAIEKSIADEKGKKGEKGEEEPIDEADEGAFAPNHYCIHHGGIQHEGKIVKATAIRHTEPNKNGFVSHYDMKLPNGTVVENVAAEDIQVTGASLMNEHGDSPAPGKRDKDSKHPKMKKALNKEGNCPKCGVGKSKGCDCK